MRITSSDTSTKISTEHPIPIESSLLQQFLYPQEDNVL